jgi:hypothetical protein
MICLNHIHIISHCYDSDILSFIGMIQTYYQSLVWFRHIISHWYDSDISSVIGMIQTYYESMVWFRYIISHWHDSGNMFDSYQWLTICLNHTNDWYYAWIIPMTDSMSASYQCMIQTWQSLVWFRHIISHWYDSDILSVIGMIQTYYQSLVWFRHIISHWYDSDICLNHTNDW